MSDGMLIKQEKYLETGIHIGTKLRTIDMAKFIYRTRNDGLYVLDLRQIDERIRLVGKVLSKFDPEEIVVIASRTYSSIAARVFAQLTGAKVIVGRFVPGAFTNVARADFVEPKLVFICDPKGERQAVVECGKMGISTVGLCDTDNFTMFIDWAIPCNNKGRRALALIFWLLAREIAMSKGKIGSYEEFTPDFEAFETLANEFADQDMESKKKGKRAVKTEELSEESAPVVEEETSDSEEKEEPESEVADDKKPKKSSKAKKKTVKKPVKKSEANDEKPEEKKVDEKKEEKAEEKKVDEKKEEKAEEKKVEEKAEEKKVDEKAEEKKVDEKKEEKAEEKKVEEKKEENK